MLVAFVFIAAFAVVALLLMAVTAGRAQESKQTRARLAAIGNVPVTQTAEEELDIVRHDEVLSSVPWIDRWLRKLDFAPRMRLLLYQADLKWTVGKLVLMSVVAGV